MLLKKSPASKHLLTAEAKVSGVHLVCAGAAAQDVLQDLTSSLHDQPGQISTITAIVEPSEVSSLLTQQKQTGI